MASGVLPDAYGGVGMQEKYWNACYGNDTASLLQHQDSSVNSALSTQDGFLPCCADPSERATSIECDVPCAPASAWTSAPQGWCDQDYDATCTSSSYDLCSKDGIGGQSKEQSAGAVDVVDDAAAQQDVVRTKAIQQPALSPAEQQRLRASKQLEDLLAMIRNEQESEQQLSPSCGFLEQQDAASGQPITAQMLMIVTSWLSEVSFEFSMQQETLFLAVALLNRFLDASTGVPRGVLQLVAVACMMLAAKQDEVVHPTVQELTDIAANCFTAQDLLRMERILLDSLSWRVKTPTAYTFLHLYTQSTAAMRAAGGVALLHASLASGAAPLPGSSVSEPLTGAVVAKAAYLTELALLDYGMLEFKPSMVAASALLLAESWSPQGAAVEEMHAISGFAAGDLSACMTRLLSLHQYAGAAGSCESLAPLVFIKDKYAQDCWLKASLQDIPVTSTLPAGSEAAAAAGVQGAAPACCDAPSDAGACGAGAQPMEM